MDGRSVYDQSKPGRWRTNSSHTAETKMEHGYDGWRSEFVNSADKPRSSTQGFQTSGQSEADRRSSHTVYGQETADVGIRSRDRLSNVSTSRSSRFDQSSSKYYNDDGDRFLKAKGVDNNDEYAGRRSPYYKPRSRDNTDESDRRPRGREHRGRREDHEHSRERDASDYQYHSKRRSRSRDRDRQKRDLDLDRRHRDSDRNRHQRERDRVKRDRSSSPRDIPWVPPPLPEHLRQLQVQWALTPVKSEEPSPSISWVAPQPPVSSVQNQFQNDGSFMEMFKQKMQSKASAGKSSNDSASLQIESSAASSTPPKTAETKPGLSSTLATSSGMPVIAKRRLTKILKTGVVQKKKPASEEPDDKEGVSSSYMKEVQKYRANKCIENEASRPPLVK